MTDKEILTEVYNRLREGKDLIGVSKIPDVDVLDL